MIADWILRRRRLSWRQRRAFGCQNSSRNCSRVGPHRPRIPGFQDPAEPPKQIGDLVVNLLGASNDQADAQKKGHHAVRFLTRCLFRCVANLPGPWRDCRGYQIHDRLHVDHRLHAGGWSV